MQIGRWNLPSVRKAGCCLLVGRRGNDDHDLSRHPLDRVATFYLAPEASPTLLLLSTGGRAEFDACGPENEISVGITHSEVVYCGRSPVFYT